MDKDKNLIPKGMYCYTRGESIKNGYVIDPCPYWERKEDLPEQDCGYCNYLELGDASPNGTLLLWDMVKECGINDEFENEEAY